MSLPQTTRWQGKGCFNYSLWSVPHEHMATAWRSLDDRALGELIGEARCASTSNPIPVPPNDAHWDIAGNLLTTRKSQSAGLSEVLGELLGREYGPHHLRGDIGRNMSWLCGYLPQRQSSP